mgnify:CR=1 FL=1
MLFTLFLFIAIALPKSLPDMVRKGTSSPLLNFSSQSTRELKFLMLLLKGYFYFIIHFNHHPIILFTQYIYHKLNLFVKYLQSIILLSIN